MTLKEFRELIEGFPEDYVFKYGISKPFSWRGNYGEVAFTIIFFATKREDVLNEIKKASSKQFTGYKGGTYKYNDKTEVHFENGASEYSDRGYSRGIIRKILKYKKKIEDSDEMLIKLLFSLKK